MRRYNLTAYVIGSAMLMTTACAPALDGQTALPSAIETAAVSDRAETVAASSSEDALESVSASPEAIEDLAAVESRLAADANVVTIEEEAVPLYSKPAGSHVRTPSASGAVTYGNNLVTVDASNTSQGYVMIKYTGSNPKIKVQITPPGGKGVYTYNLDARSDYEVFPLTEGNGSYSVKVFENKSGNQYLQAFSQDIAVSLTDSFSPFLYPNQYVNFTASSAVVKKGAEVAAAATDQASVVAAVFNYVVDNFTYDNAKANSVASGYLPNVDQVLAQKTGICFDYAAVMTAMLRSQDIPTKLVVGYTGSVYHAWVNIYIEGQGWIENVIYFDGQDWTLMDPTFASSSKKSPEIMEYMKNPANYQARYTY